MCVFYYRAYDRSGIERHGVIDAPDERSADRRLRKTGLKPFYIGDYTKIRKKVSSKKSKKGNRRRIAIFALGGVSILVAVWFSGFIVAYAGRQQAPDIAQYQAAGVLQGATNTVFGDTPETREFAKEMALLWRDYAPDTLSGVECTRHLVTIYAKEKIAELPRDELELLTVQVLKAQKRRFGVPSPSVLLVRGEEVMMEATFFERDNAVDLVYY